MKKIILVFATMMFLFSCSSETEKVPEDNETEEVDIIVGSWKFIKKKGEEAINNCDFQDTYVFRKDNSYSFNDYNDNSGLCEKDAKESRKGYWKNNNNKTYNIKIQGYEGNGADLNIIFSDDNQELTFSNNGFTYRKSPSI
ncbi:lipocalin family protein [Tenacibaculum piscium]|uniref:lipocalin family protein n=1 Tax=Tenacibaculum piscium TaxID=1458515 RepID=UPI001F44A6BE|nr:lipocalin family protein [Tenacibaculum piscium]MCG8184271.1 hypothetical protein [Tenacibaculum piscium]MCG8205561.1 hypothetical protein [Tenacibaculum piscium]